MWLPRAEKSMTVICEQANFELDLSQTQSFGIFNDQKQQLLDIKFGAYVWENGWKNVKFSEFDLQGKGRRSK